MNTESFLKEELPKIDSLVSQKKTLFSFDEFSVFDLLLFAATEEVFFFESKEEDMSFLGLGKSLEFTPNEALDYIKNHPDSVLAYQDTFEQDLAPNCYLPEWSFIKKDGKVHLHVHKSLEFQSYSPSNLIFNLSVWESFVGSWMSYEEQPESDEWEKMINSASRLFQKETLEKIVLSRKKIFTYDSLVEMPVLFRELYLANKNSSHFSVYHQFNYQEAFISFTPERLFTLKGDQIESVSLAGSIARGSDEEQDRILELEMNNSDKLTREHNIVTKSIEEKLKPILSQLTISPLFTMKLPYIQHRQAKISGVLKDETSAIDLISRLHPTPAVGGIPQDIARTKILEIEKTPRGYYAAPVGILSKDFSEIAVGIRSGLIIGQELTVFGGAGIVAGSTATEEWTETGIKMQPFIKVINKSTL
jgi:isochorismate synthase